MDTIGSVILGYSTEVKCRSQSCELYNVNLTTKYYNEDMWTDFLTTKKDHKADCKKISSLKTKELLANVI